MYNNYCENMECINANIDFFKNERDYALNKMEQVQKSAISHEETKNEIIAEWLKIANKMDEYLAYYYSIKKEINISYCK